MRRGGRCLLPVFALGRAQVSRQAALTSSDVRYTCDAKAFFPAADVVSCCPADLVCQELMLILDEYWAGHRDLQKVRVDLLAF